jgi:hypothetical protein
MRKTLLVARRDEQAPPFSALVPLRNCLGNALRARLTHVDHCEGDARLPRRIGIPQQSRWRCPQMVRGRERWAGLREKDPGHRPKLSFIHQRRFSRGGRTARQRHPIVPKAAPGACEYRPEAYMLHCVRRGGPSYGCLHLYFLAPSAAFQTIRICCRALRPTLLIRYVVDKAQGRNLGF